MKTFGQVLREARKKAGLTQREVAGMLKRQDGRLVDPPYLNAVEHDHRYPPEDFLIEQLAKIVRISPDVLYFHANRQPPDVKTEAPQKQVEAAYRAFRRPWGSGRANENEVAGRFPPEIRDCMRRTACYRNGTRRYRRTTRWSR